VPLRRGGSLFYNPLDTRYNNKKISTTKDSPPSEGGVAAASADGVVLSSIEISSFGATLRENHPAEAAPLLRKEGSLFCCYLFSFVLSVAWS
jgi:hypothetical protein